MDEDRLPDTFLLASSNFQRPLDGTPRNYEVGLDIQGEAIRILEPDSEVDSDCSECEEALAEAEETIGELEDTVEELEFEAASSSGTIGGLYFDDPGYGQWYLYAAGLYAEYDTATETITYGGVTMGVEVDSPRISGTGAGPVFYAVYEDDYRRLLNYGSTTVIQGTTSDNVFEYAGYLPDDNGGSPLSHIEVELNSPHTVDRITRVTISFV